MKARVTESYALDYAIKLMQQAGGDEAVTQTLQRMKSKLDKPPITIKRRKAKGRELQQSIRSDLMNVFGIDPKDILSTPGGVNWVDIYLAQAARKQFPFGVECKNQETLNFWASWDQAATNAEAEGLYPMLILHRNRAKTLCVIEWDLFKKMVRGKEKC